MPQLSFHSPLGDLTLTDEAGAIVSLDWGWSSHQGPSPLLIKAKEQLEEYFDGTRTEFDLPLAPRGTAHQRKVWKAIAAIPYGKTLNYGQIAKKIRSAPRAVGQACGRNPITVIVPCHRVLGAKGALGGYSGGDGRATKLALLRLEGVAAAGRDPLDELIAERAISPRRKR